MAHFKLTHFDPVWRALSDPANGGLAAAFRTHFEHVPLPSDAKDAAVARLNFLLDRCGSPRVERGDVEIRDATWHVQLRDGRVARSLEGLAQSVVVGSEHRPRVFRDGLVPRMFRKARDAVTGKLSVPDGERSAPAPARTVIQQGLPYDVSAPIPGDLAASGEHFHSTRPYAPPHASALGGSPHYLQVGSGSAGAPAAGPAAPRTRAPGLS